MVQRDHSYPGQVFSFGEFDVDEGLRQIRRKAAVVAQLTQALERGRGGRGAFLVIAGEPGIGKTRTIEELTRCARASMRCRS